MSTTERDEELRRDFLDEYGPDTDQMVSAHQSFMPAEIANWWLLRIVAEREEARKEERERIKEGPKTLIRRKELNVKGFIQTFDICNKEEILALLNLPQE